VKSWNIGYDGEQNHQTKILATLFGNTFYFFGEGVAIDSAPLLSQQMK
jgi:hypothetical protein